MASPFPSVESKDRMAFRTRHGSSKIRLSLTKGVRSMAWLLTFAGHRVHHGAGGLAMQVIFVGMICICVSEQRGVRRCKVQGVLVRGPCVVRI